MKTKKRERIAVLFELAEEQFPDKSTEFLFQIVCDRAWMQDRIRIDCADVAEALHETP